MYGLNSVPIEPQGLNGTILFQYVQYIHNPFKISFIEIFIHTLDEMTM